MKDTHDYKTEKVGLQQLLLDPNNYRFLDMKEYVAADSSRFHIESVQQKAQTLIEADGWDELRALKESIQANGYVPIETIIVRPYAHREGLYVVVEGNRRVAAMRWLLRDAASGVVVSRDLLDSFKGIPVIVLDPTVANYANLQHTLMGLRHVSGIKEWGGYQRAMLVVEMVDEHKTELSDAAKAIGMSIHEAKRRYRAFRALHQMQRDEEFGAYATPKMYPLFHEAVAQPKIREWLGWKEERNEFANEENKREFYKLLVPYTQEEDEENPRPQEPKLRTYADVRSLSEVLGNDEAEESLFDPNQPYSDALAIAKASASPNWLPRLRAAQQALDRIPVLTLKNLDRSAINPLVKLYGALKERLSDWQKLTGRELEL